MLLSSRALLLTGTVIQDREIQLPLGGNSNCRWAGVAAKPVIIQFARTDQTAANPSATAILRAGDLADVATYYRHDLAYAETPTGPKNPHGFILLGLFGYRDDVAAGAQEQIATFFASDGATIIHPEPARFFEVPIVPPLPEDLVFIP